MALSTLLVSPVLGCTKPYNHSHWNRQLTRAVALLNSSTHSLLSHRFQSDPMFVHWPDFYVTFWVLLLDFQDEPTQIFFPLLKFCGYLIPAVGGEELSIETSWTWDIPTLCRRQTFSPLSSLMQSATLWPFHSYQGVAAVGFATTIACSTSFSRGSQSVFGQRYFCNVDLRGIQVLNGCIPSLIHKSNRDYNLSLPSLLR